MDTNERLHYYMDGFEIDIVPDAEGNINRPDRWGWLIREECEDQDLIDAGWIRQNPLNPLFYYITPDGAAQIERYAYSPFDNQGDANE